LWMARDPITSLEARLTRDYDVGTEEFDRIKSGIERTLDEAAEFADASAHPAPEDGLEDVCAQTYGGAVLQ
jgi:TPP-dependent pyruvate/acetoin dehydrogenase alpha subunit